MNHPIIHFSKNSENIINEGFKYGAKKEDIDMTFDIAEKNSSGDIIRTKENSGINYAFDALSYSFENDCNDYEYGIEGGEGMYEEKAVLFIADSIKTNHMENFEQCLFYGESIELEKMILLKNEGTALAEEGEPDFDENGIEYDKWSAYSKEEGFLVEDEENLSLSDCVSLSIRKMIGLKKYSKNLINKYNVMCSEDFNKMDLLDSNKELTSIEVKEIVNFVRSNLIDDCSMNENLSMKKTELLKETSNRLLKKGFESKIKSGVVGQKERSHSWIETEEFIIDPLNENFNFVLKKELNNKYKKRRSKRRP